MSEPIPYQWKALESDDEPWSVEIEFDVFDFEEGPVVSIWTEAEEADRTHQTLVRANALQAREMAAMLLLVAEQIERAAARDRTGATKQDGVV